MRRPGDRDRRWAGQNGQSGQAFIETLLMLWLLTLLMSAIIQVFLVHNYAYQMANNAYYSLFKDRAYGRHNEPDMPYDGYPNFRGKPLRAVTALQQAGGKIHVTAGGPINWSQDDRAAVPMMPYFESAIIEQLESNGITRAPVRLKIGTATGQNYLNMKFLRMGMGTEGGFGAFFGMIGALIDMSGELGANYSDYTEGYSQDDLDDMWGDYGDANDDLEDQDEDGGQKAKDRWDNEHGDYNHDGYNDACENVQGNNNPNCKNNRPWE